jgi:hypothetical protein
LLLGGSAGFLGLVWAAFWWLVDSVTGSGAFPVAMGSFALLGLVGASLAKHRPRVCAGLESLAGIGLLATGHFLLGSPILAAATLALASLRTAPPAETTGATLRTDARSALSVVGLTGVAVVSGFLLPVILLLVVVAALSGH